MIRELRFLAFACSVPVFITLGFMWGITKAPAIVAAPAVAVRHITRQVQVSSPAGDCHAIITLRSSPVEKKEIE